MAWMAADTDPPIRGSWIEIQSQTQEGVLWRLMSTGNTNF